MKCFKRLIHNIGIILMIVFVGALIFTPIAFYAYYLVSNHYNAFWFFGPVGLIGVIGVAAAITYEEGCSDE